MVFAKDTLEKIQKALESIVAPFNETEDFIKALAELADAAKNLSNAANKVIRFWPVNNGIPAEIKEMMAKIQKWIGEQGGGSKGIQWEKLPLTLTVKEVASIMRIGRNQAYQLCKGSIYKFPAIQSGRKFIIPRDKFREWLDGRSK